MSNVYIMVLGVFLLGCTTAYQEAGHVEEHKLSSILYELAIAPDPEYFANQHHIPLNKKCTKAYIYFDPASSGPAREKIIEAYHLTVEKRSVDVLRAWVPVNRLIPLSNESIIQTIQLPSNLIKTKKIKP